MKLKVLITVVLLIGLTACNNVNNTNIAQKPSGVSETIAKETAPKNQEIENTNDSNLTEKANSTAVQQSTSDADKALINGFSALEVKNAIVDSINNDIWYNGKNSEYFFFQSNELGIEVYNEGQVIHVLFTDKVKNPRDENQELYYSNNTKSK